MNKIETWLVYEYVRKRLTPEERKQIEIKNGGLLKASDRECGIHLKAKLTCIMNIINGKDSLSTS